MFDVILRAAGKSPSTVEREVIDVGQNEVQRPNSRQQSYSNEVYSKDLLLYHEKEMFMLLRKAVPECFIFPKVCLGEILEASNPSMNNALNSDVAQYVVADSNFFTLAVIEFDCGDNGDKAYRQTARDKALRKVGYKVIRYEQMPTRADLRSAILE